MPCGLLITGALLLGALEHVLPIVSTKLVVLMGAEVNVASARQFTNAKTARASPLCLALPL